MAKTGTVSLKKTDHYCCFCLFALLVGLVGGGGGVGFFSGGRVVALDIL